MASRNVLITGGAGGLGRGLVAAFKAAGDRVTLGDLDAARVSEAAGAAGVSGVAVDITDADSVARALDQVGELDVLVNNAGIVHLHGPVLSLPIPDFDAIFAVNVHGTFTVTQAVAGRMVAAGRGGSIINISSTGSRQPTPGMGAYESSKAAVDALTRWAAIELAEHHIRVNAVAPGPIMTPMLAPLMAEGSPARDAWLGRIPMRKIAAIEDVAAAVLFLAGAQAAHITGVSLPVDGGQLLA